LCLEAFRDDAQRFAGLLEELAATGVLDHVAALGIGWLHGVQAPGGCGRFDVVADAALSLTSSSTPVHQLGVFGHRCPHAVLPVGAPARLVDGELSVRWPDRPS
jgi:muramoyltetrapeptide carboxypeptidase LdcA involved in peptidoglycan recycling